MKKVPEILEEVRSLDPDERQELLSELMRKYIYKPSTAENPHLIATIKGIVCTYYGIPYDQIMAETRKGRIVFARQLIMYFARRMTTYSLSYIGMQCGERDHATVIHGYSKIDKLMRENEKVKEVVRVISDQIKSAIYTDAAHTALNALPSENH